MNQELEKILNNPLIAQSKIDYIKNEFFEFESIASEWNEKAYSIAVTDENQLDLMEQAKEGKKLLKAKRIEIEKKRKSLKEQSLNEGRLIDSVAKHLTLLIEPAEKYLELQEKYAEIKEYERKQELKRQRVLLLEPYYEVIDPSTIQLDIISEEAFTTILNGAKYALEQKRAEEKRIEQERIALVEKEKKEREAMRLELEAEKLKSEAIQRELNEAKERETQEREAMRIEIEAEKQRSEAVQKALDEANEKEKGATIKLKEVSIELKTIKKTQTENNDVAKVVKTENELLQAKCNHYETSLNNVLFYIVPDQCRTMVELALVKGRSDFK